jgi:hypothetical protein
MIFVNKNEKFKSLATLADAQNIGDSLVSFLFSNSKTITID